MPERWPDLAALELLVAVSERGSLGAAARFVGMAQPNATRMIARLERSFGIRLIDRHPRGSRLTADGAVVMDWAQNLLDNAQQLRVASEALRLKHRTHLTVAASMTIAECLMPAWLAELRRAHPDSKITLRVCNSEEVFDQVTNSACDVGFVETPGVRATLRSTAVAHDRLVVVVSPAHPWSRRRTPLTAKELANTPLVVRETGSGTRITLEAALKGLDAVAPTLELNSNAAVRVSVAAGAGPAVLSELAVVALLKAGELIAIPVEGLSLKRTMRAVWNKSVEMDGIAGDLVRVARRSL